MHPRIKGSRLACATMVALVALAGAVGSHAATPAQKCQAGKNNVAGKYAACRHKAEAKLATTGDGAAYTTALGKCTDKYSDAWQKLEANAGGACPSNGDEIPVENVVNGYTSDIATAVGGGALSDCPAELTSCNGDLATCQSALSGADGQRLKTGQTVCYNTSGTVIACAGTGQDGELQKGQARSYTDNGDGTITDNRTGLMWEKLADDGSIHDKDNAYTWSDAFAVKIATLNSGSFAGHNDWRLPNVNELQSLVHYGAVDPAVDAAFNTGCAFTCTVTTCSCIQSFHYWSATSLQDSALNAWDVSFYGGFVSVSDKPGNSFYVRGVRGG